MSNDGRFKKGQVPWNKDRHLSTTHKENLSDSHKGLATWNKGTTGLCKPNSGSFQSGKNHPGYQKYGKDATGWRGGLTSLNKIIRESSQYNEWRNIIYKRDNYTCQICGIKNINTLNSHHKKRLSLIISENKIKTFEAALNCSEVWDINNGITYCEKCHYYLHGRK